MESNPYLTTYCVENSIDFYTLVVDDKILEDLNSDYRINLNIIEAYFNKSYFDK